MDVLSGRMGRTIPSIEERSECRLGVTFHGDDITSTCISKSGRGPFNMECYMVVCEDLEPCLLVWTQPAGKAWPGSGWTTVAG
jgi:hypothetical protein